MAVENLLVVSTETGGWPEPALGFATHFNQLGRPAQALGAAVGAALRAQRVAAEAEVGEISEGIWLHQSLGAVEGFRNAAIPPIGYGEAERVAFNGAIRSALSETPLVSEVA